MKTVGVDLAAEPKKTAVATIDWIAGSAVLEFLGLGISDPDIVLAARGAASVGIDCPFGWPLEFLEFVAAHARGEVAPHALVGGDWRRRLAYRETDRDVRERVKKWPLSVSTDRLGLTAMHCAELLDLFEREGETIDRSGGGRLAEIYPGAALRIWGVDVARYKTDPDALVRATAQLCAHTPWLVIGEGSLQLMRKSDDAFDAVVAALIARAHATGRALAAPSHLRETARSEGWIILPTGALGDLVTEPD
jgi:predicted nuclease with RNAse H fold